MNNKPVRYLTLEQILAIHGEQIELYGGGHGLRDLALLESAIFRPQSTFGGQELYPTIFLKAAGLMTSLALNHPFVDGNKRTATVSALTFLYLNGYIIKVSQAQLVNSVLKIESKQWDVKKLANWFEDHSSRHH